MVHQIFHKLSSILIGKIEYNSFETSITKRSLKVKQIYGRIVSYVLLCMTRNGGVSALQRKNRRYHIAVQSAIKISLSNPQKIFQFQICDVQHLVWSKLELIRNQNNQTLCS